MPISSFQVDIRVPPQIVAERLRAVVQPSKFFRMAWSPLNLSHPFVGKVRDGSFKIQRDIRGRNSFLPVVWGRMVGTPSGTRLKVIMFIHPLVVIFMAIWFGMAADFAIKDNDLLPVSVV